MNCYRKMYNRWLLVMPTNHVLPEPDLHIVGPLAVWDFCNIFLPNASEDQNSLIHERGAPGTVPYVKSVPGYCITFIQRLQEGLS